MPILITPYHMSDKFTAALAAMLLLTACGRHDGIKVTVDNNLDFDRNTEMAELPADSVLAMLGSEYCYITDSDGNEVPSQITSDRLLIFRPSVKARQSAVYTLHQSDTMHVYECLASGRLYPKRADDLAWENDIVGFRAYGPATQAKGEKAYGYDIFFKYPQNGLVLEKLYAPETDAATWEKVDSLRRIDPAMADEFINTFSYHIDHGLGMDCYAVGPTLGAGVAAVLDNDTISMPWCYDKAEITDNGPLRFTARLTFAPRAIGTDTAVTEHRIITLDAGSHLNRCSVSYEGLQPGKSIVAGMPRRDDSPAVLDADNGILAYADPTQGDDNGKALLGIVFPDGIKSARETDGHIVGETSTDSEGQLTYYWGFAWSKTGTASLTEWNDRLNRVRKALSSPLSVTVGD